MSDLAGNRPVEAFAVYSYSIVVTTFVADVFFAEWTRQITAHFHPNNRPFERRCPKGRCRCNSSQSSLKRQFIVTQFRSLLPPSNKRRGPKGEPAVVDHVLVETTRVHFGRSCWKGMQIVGNREQQFPQKRRHSFLCLRFLSIEDHWCRCTSI